MLRPEFSVALADLESGSKVVDFGISEQWLARALEGSGAVPRGGTGRLHVELTKNGREVLVRGHATVAVSMPCVVTLDPLPFDLDPEILLLLSPSDAPAPGRRKHATPPGKRASHKKGKRARWMEEPELTAEEAGRDHFSGDHVVLDDFVREFILLELPAYPRRSDLPSPGDAAIAPAPEPRGPASLDAAAAGPIDPRLKPLAELAKRLVSKAEKE